MAPADRLTCTEHPMFDNAPMAPYNVATPPIRSCYDTTRAQGAGLLIDSEHRVLEVMQWWNVAPTAADSAFDALANAVIGDHGAPSTKCQSRHGYEAERELLWNGPGHFTRVQMTGAGFVIRTEVLGEPSCAIGPPRPSAGL